LHALKIVLARRKFKGGRHLGCGAAVGVPTTSGCGSGRRWRVVEGSLALGGKGRNDSVLVLDTSLTCNRGRKGSGWVLKKTSIAPRCRGRSVSLVLKASHTPGGKGGSAFSGNSLGGVYVVLCVGDVLVPLATAGEALGGRTIEG